MDSKDVKAASASARADAGVNLTIDPSTRERKVLAARAFKAGEIVHQEAPLFSTDQDVDSYMSPALARVAADYPIVLSDAYNRNLPELPEEWKDSKTVHKFFSSFRGGQLLGRIMYKYAINFPGLLALDEDTQEWKTATVRLGFFPTASFINHDCVGNCTVAHCFPASTDEKLLRQRRIVFKATRDIAKGDEITFPYAVFPENTPRNSRRAFLKASFGFDCQCSVCA